MEIRKIEGTGFLKIWESKNHKKGSKFDEFLNRWDILTNNEQIS